jgi:hypothetical protein
MPLVSTLELRRFDLIDVATVIGFYMFLRCRRCKLPEYFPSGEFQVIAGKVSFCEQVWKTKLSLSRSGLIWNSEKKNPRSEELASIVYS